MVQKRIRWVCISIAAALFCFACEKVGSGTAVSIPLVSFTCMSSKCVAHASASKAIAVITSSGCDSPDIGAVAAASIQNVTCSNANGCTGHFSSWVDSGNISASTVPSNTYSICVRIDYDGHYPPAGANESNGVLDNVSITTATTPQSVTAFIDR